MVTGENDICAAAKFLKTFAAEFERPPVKAGILDDALLNAEQIKVLADLPSKDVLQARLLGFSWRPRPSSSVCLTSPLPASPACFR